MDRPYITCRKLIEFIADYLGGEVDEIEKSDFERHLGKCPSCNAYLDSYVVTMALVRESESDAHEAEIPPELARMILAHRTAKGTE